MSHATTLDACPSCGAALNSGEVCWLCQRKYHSADPIPVNPYAVGFDADPTPAMNTASISSPGLFVALVLGLILANAALYALAPGLGLLLTIMLTPALIRTVVVTAKRKSHGGTIRTGDRTLLLLASMAAVTTAMLSAGIAFFVACVSVCFFALGTGSIPLSESVLFGSAIGLGAIVFVGTLVLFWRRRR